MNAQPKYPTKGPGDLTGPGDPQNEPESAGSLLENAADLWGWLHEGENAALLTECRDGALLVLLDYVTSPFKDIYARNKLQRQMVELAQRCEDAIRKAEEGRRAA